ncbi:hypothetical protein [Halomonas sp. KX33721]|uniref:hypothetical protein n=1 Tax=Halomonas sp. KX33721 TaxID=1819251 RepID=UPI000781A2C3|nr:hypothetical protein [Halomonas sp. KX33721]
MSEQIDRFLSSLENWKESFEVKNFDTTGDDELSQIIAMQRNKDVDGLLKIWERKLEQDYFELPHPIFSDVITRAVYSVQHGMANFVFMVDSGNKFPWVFGQCQGFIDYILTNEYHFKASLSIESPVVDKIKNLHKLKSKYLRFENRRFGFLLGQARPYHFFLRPFEIFLFFKRIK